MALHRDIFWVGRQWAVTGFGLQAIDQRLKGAIDIEIARLWDDDLVARRRAMAGINVEDFSRALDIARTRFFQPPGDTPPPSKPASSCTPEGPAIAAPPRLPPLPMLRAEGSLARFVPQWRVRR